MDGELDEEYCQECQENEKAALKAIYGDEVTAVSGSNGEKKPLECQFFLGPLASSRRRTINDPSVELHVICSKSYPYVVPEIKIVKWKKVSNNSITILSDQLQSLAKKLKGEVMIFQLASHVESFLLESIQHGFESFYDEMITRNKEKEEKEMNERKKREEKKREEILQQIQSKQQAVKKALKKKNDTRKSVCEEETRDLTKEEKIIISVEEKDTSKLENPIQPMNQLDSEELTQLYMSARPGQTRFENEFQHIQWIGKGAFGDVLKVRNRLDDGYYAIKRIQLNASNKQLNKKIVREVKLLSRLNHENVVRYYNSWIEHGTCLPLQDDEDKEDEEDDEDDESDKKLEKDLKPTVGILPRIHDISPEWSEKEEESSRESSESDWVDFRSSSRSRHDKSTGEPDSNETKDSTKNVFYYLYIQMELCGKSTLRIAIDSGLYEEGDRVWRLLREIIEGLCHIHQQGIIHRDLKPVNIFIGNDDHVKIGDFGLATSSVLQKSGLSRDLTLPTEQGDKSGSFLAVSTSQKDNLLTGKVGTMYYVAPELSDYNPRLNYNQKVDIYSLGIIFFEMCHPPFQTSMERFKVLSDVRLANPVFPAEFQYNENSDQVKLLRWMLNHDVKERPNSLELLQSDFLPPPKLEEGEVKEMVRRTLTNPQSKDYKFLVASCFQQVMQPALDATFNISSWRSLNFNYGLEFVCQKIKAVFRQHGAVSFMPPLFTPAHQPVSDSAVCLMTRLGGIVYATHDLRSPFARYLIQNPHITHLKRYAIDKVYREKPAGIHPKEIYECSFDIVTPTSGNLMPELEILSIIWEVLNEFPSILQRNCVLYLNHSVLVSSLLSISGIDESKQKSLGKLIFKAKEKSQNKSELSNQLKSLSLSDFSISNVLSWIDKEGNSNKMEAEIEELIDDPSTLNKCKAIFQQIDKIIQQCEILGFTSPVLVKLGLMTNAHNYSGLIIQIVCDQRSRNKYMENNIILSGGRYDKLLSDLREVSPFGERKFNQSVCGFTLYLDKLITILSSQEKISVIDVLICTLGTIQITMDRIKLLKDLWRSGIKSYFINTMETLDDIHDFCQDQHIPVIVLLKESEPTYARVKTRVKDKSVSNSKDRYIEKKVPCNDLVDFLAKIVNKNHESLTPLKIENSRASISEAININLLPVEKINPSAKRRFESQISNAVSSVVQRFSSKVKVDVIAVSLETEALKLYSNCLDLATGEHDMNTFIKKFPRHKKYAYKIMESVEDLRKQHHSLVVILYSLLDNTFKVNM